MHRLAQTLDAVRATRSKKEKTALLAALFRALEPSELAPAARLLLGQLLPATGARPLGVGWALAVAAAAELTGRSEREVGLATREAGDFGDALAALLPARPPGLPLSALPAAMQALAAAGDRAEKHRLLVALLTRAAPDEARYLAKALLGELRVGVQRGTLEEALARAFDAPLEALRAAAALTPDVGALAELAARRALAEAGLAPGQPVAFMLATPNESLREPVDPSRTVVEDKLDGVRVQAHVSPAPEGATVRLFARGQGEVTRQFPEVAEALARLPRAAILDGEVIAVALAPGAAGVGAGHAAATALDAGIAASESRGGGSAGEPPTRAPSQASASASGAGGGAGEPPARAPPQASASASGAGGGAGEPPAHAPPQATASAAGAGGWVGEPPAHAPPPAIASAATGDSRPRSVGAPPVTGDGVRDTSTPVPSREARLLAMAPPAGATVATSAAAAGASDSAPPPSARTAPFIARPFQALQARLGRTAPDAATRGRVPVAYVAFDVLYDGESLLERPWLERRARLQRLLDEAPPPEAPSRLLLNPVTPLEPSRPVGPQLDALFAASRARGNEGLMLKRTDARYEAGRRGAAWRKVKRALATLDVVVTRAERGHGKRAGVLSDYTFAVWKGPALVEIGKAYSGLTDAELAALTSRLEALTLRRAGPYHLVKPELVLEVAFDGVQRSRRHDSGFALRFPRIVRLRDDKRPEDADRLEAARALFEAQVKSGHREEPAQLGLFGAE